MKGDVRSILAAYDGTYRELKIPVYQRNYDWQLKQCSRLFDDLEEILASGGKRHFFGSIVGKMEGSFLWIVIDGQQRLTTISLLILALVHASVEQDIRLKDKDLPKKIFAQYLRCGSESEELKFKLKPIKDDASAYRALFSKNVDEYYESSNITVNYRYMRERLKQTVHTADEIWEAIGHLDVMLLNLDEPDDPQRIFESLNSTGLELRESDKIRNFILMGLSDTEQTRLYNERWNPLEKNSNFKTDSFIRWYLTTKTSATPKEQELYDAFKDYASSSKQENHQSMERLLDDLFEYSKLFQGLTTAQTGIAKADILLSRINPMMGQVVLPFLMPTLHDTKCGIITEADFVQILTILESYLFRRNIVGAQSNALNKIFATAYKEIRKLHKPGTNYSDILVYTLNKREGSGRYPTDREFEEEFKTRNMYKIRSELRSYMFDLLENRDSKDIRDIAGALNNKQLSVEHIMPQKLTPEWSEMLGDGAEEIHATWVHRIGNLTVTGYNSSYSNSSFTNKKAMENGLESSPYRINEYVKSENTWGLHQLETRTNELAKLALTCWPSFSTEFAPPETYMDHVPMGTHEDGAEFHGRKLTSVEYKTKKFFVNTWSAMLPMVMQWIASERRTEILQFARTSVWISTKSESVRGWKKVDEGLWVNVACDTEQKIAWLRALFKYLNLDPDDLVFALRPINAHKGVAEDYAESEDWQSPYAELTKYVDVLKELQEVQNENDGFNQLYKDFTDTFLAFDFDLATTEYANSTFDILAHVSDMDEVSDTHALAVIAMIVKMSEMMGQSFFNQQVIQGELLKWIMVLQRF